MMASFDGVGDEAAVEGGELASVGVGQGQQVGVSDLLGGKEAGGIEVAAVEDADVVGPEDVAGEGEEFAKQFCKRGGTAGGIGIALVAQDAEDGVFGERASSPGLLSVCGEPIVGVAVVNVIGIE